jgi:LuxR family maltose regulon positive regulatory protein
MGDELTLLGPRSRVARLPEIFVRRPRLDALLADGARRAVTLISAPPGAGKTTLVSAALGPRRDVVPIRVDGRDNEPGQLAGVIAAALIEQSLSGTGRIEAAISAPTLLDAAFGSLQRTGQHVVLVLDDVHELRSSDALATLDYLVEHAPPTLDVVLCSRADPPVRLTRLRLDGRLGEIRNDSLAFDLGETADLLVAHGVRLTRPQVQSLWKRTEGWAAGLRLAACALHGESDPREFVQSAASSESVVVDYLLKELLSRQDEGAQQFLLRTSVAERLTPSLAQALTHDPQTGMRLADLERNGVFLREVEDRTWYRYHPLFGTLLEARLRHYHQDLAGDLHRRAAAWFLDEDMPREAEAHARAAGDWPLLSRLASRRWVERTLAGVDGSDGLLAGIPATAFTASGGLAVVAAADACMRRDRPAADTLRAAADELASPAPSAPGDATAALDASPPEARALLDIAYARAFGVDERARTAISTLRSTVRATDPDCGGARLADLRSLGLDLDQGETERARRDAAALALMAESTWIGVEALALLALTEAVEGEVDLADRHGERALAVNSAPHPGPRHVACLAMALCLALRGERRRAIDALDDEVVPVSADAWLRATDGAVRSVLRTPGTAFVGLAADDASHALVGRALVALGVLEVVETSGRVHGIGGPLESGVLLARQRWRSGDAAGVLAVLDDASDAGPAAPHPRTAIERSGLMALAAGRLGDADATVRALRGALDGAATTGIWAPLLVLASDLTGPLEFHADELGRHQSIALELIDRSRQSPAPAFVEPLTEREIAVLRHLPTLMSNHEIADGLHVSINTVKTHLKSLYRKLGAASRREAVQRGRTLELL